jgi:hypothetical protein
MSRGSFELPNFQIRSLSCEEIAEMRDPSGLTAAPPYAKSGSQITGAFLLESRAISDSALPASTKNSPFGANAKALNGVGTFSWDDFRE